jgi:hypothetical protein
MRIVIIGVEPKNEAIVPYCKAFIETATIAARRDNPVYVHSVID